MIIDRGHGTGAAIGVERNRVSDRLVLCPDRIQFQVGIGCIGIARLVLRNGCRGAGRPALEGVACAGGNLCAEPNTAALRFGLAPRGTAAIAIVGNGVGSGGFFPYRYKRYIAVGGIGAAGLISNRGNAILLIYRSFIVHLRIFDLYGAVKVPPLAGLKLLPALVEEI